MGMPKRAEFASGDSFLKALEFWHRRSELAYQYLRGMYDATAPSAAKPVWLTKFEGGGELFIRSVQMAAIPGSEEALKTVLSCLSSNAIHSGLKPVSVCHGLYDEGGENIWACYALLKAE